MRQQGHPQMIHGGHSTTSSAHLRETDQLTACEKGQDACLGIHRQQRKAPLFGHHFLPVLALRVHHTLIISIASGNASGF
jgi:hypothetical protein